MRTFFWMMLLCLAACSGETWQDELADNWNNNLPAQITNLRLTPDSALLNAGAGEIPASAEFDYYDPDGLNWGFDIVVEDAAGTEASYYHDIGSPSINATLQGNFSVDTTTIQLLAVSVTVYGPTNSNTLQSDFVIYGP